MVLDTSLLNTQQYKVRIKGKVEQSREMSSALPCSSYWKGSLLVALDYGRQLYFFTYIDEHSLFLKDLFVSICFLKSAESEESRINLSDEFLSITDSKNMNSLTFYNRIIHSDINIITSGYI